MQSPYSWIGPEVVRKARQRHTCDQCERSIKPGSFYSQATMRDDEGLFGPRGGLRTVKACGKGRKIHDGRPCAVQLRHEMADQLPDVARDFLETWRGDTYDSKTAAITDARNGRPMDPAKLHGFLELPITRESAWSESLVRQWARGDGASAPTWGASPKTWWALEDAPPPGAGRQWVPVEIRE